MHASIPTYVPTYLPTYLHAYIHASDTYDMYVLFLVHFLLAE